MSVKTEIPVTRTTTTVFTRPSIAIGSPREVQLRPEAGSGPVVWAAIIGSTCLLLFLLQKVLWLVVPILLGLILYYLLFPAMTWMMYKGLRGPAAVTVVMIGFVTVLAIIGVFVVPNSLQHMLDWKTSSDKYLAGGVAFLDRTLRSLEHRWAYLAQAHVADNTSAKLTQLTGSAQQYLEPLPPPPPPPHPPPPPAPPPPPLLLP